MRLLPLSEKTQKGGPPARSEAERGFVLIESTLAKEISLVDCYRSILASVATTH
jgi:hypothetical protein